MPMPSFWNFLSFPIINFFLVEAKEVLSYGCLCFSLMQIFITIKNFKIGCKVMWSFKVNRPFGGTCRLHVHGRRIRRPRNLRESRWQAWTKQKMAETYSSEKWLTFNGLYGVIYKKITLFLTIAVRTSNLHYWKFDLKQSFLRTS
jgi:hypothetical protein